MQDKNIFEACDFCDAPGFKTNGKSELICEHRANTGRCKKYDYKNHPVELVRQPSRNKPCPCGSGKNYKRCCGEHEEAHKKFDQYDGYAELDAALNDYFNNH